MKFKKFSKKTLILASLIILVVAGGFTAKNILAKTSNKEIEKFPDLARVENGDLSKKITASGTTVAADENSIFIELSQEVEEVFVEVGDVVTQGQLLVTYNITDTKKELEDKLKQAQINLSNAQITLEEITTPASGSELLDLQSQVVNAQKNIDDTKIEIENFNNTISQAETTVNNAKTDMENNERLLALGGITQLEYDKSVETYNNSVIALNEIKTNKASKEASINSLEIALQKAEINLENSQNKLNDVSTQNTYKKQLNTVETAKMNVETAQDELGKWTEATYSPISGTIIECNAVEGQMLTDSTVIMKVADLNNIDLEAYVSEYDIANVKVGQKVEMTSDGIEDKIYTGIVTKIEPVATSQSTMSGTETVVPIVVHMDNPDERVKPGFSFDMEIIVEDLAGINYIPISSVAKDENNETYVYKIDEEDKLVKTFVTLGTYSDMYVELLDGLDIDAKFIATIEDNMTDGSLLSDYKTIITGGNRKENEESSIMDNLPGGGGMPGGGMPGGGMPTGGGMRNGGGMPGGGPR